MERRAMDAQTKITHRISGLSDAIRRAEAMLKATERGYDLLADDLDRMRGELEAARARGAAPVRRGRPCEYVHPVGPDIACHTFQAPLTAVTTSQVGGSPE